MGRIWSESFPESNEVGVVDMVDMVDEMDVYTVVDDCDGADSIDAEIGEDNCPFPKLRECFRDKDLIAAVADWVGVVAGGKKTAGISWVRHTSDKILTAWSTKPAANLFFEVSRWRSFGVWVGIGKTLAPEEEVTERNRFKSEKEVILCGDAGTEVGVFR
jgi:hypothetical protein